MLTCRDFINFIADYLANDLTSTDREIFEAHLADCPACKQYLHSYQTTVVMSRSAFSDLDGPIPDDVPEELVQAILTVHRHA